MTEERPFERFSFGPFVLDTRGVLLRDGKMVQGLTHTDFEILSYLLRRAGEPVTIDEIVRDVWPEDEDDVDDNNVVGRVGKIRRAIGDDPKNPTYIKTLRNKHGYYFEKAMLTAEPPVPPPSPTTAPPPAPVSFSDLDTIHVHVDGGSDEAPVEEIVTRFGREGRPSKMNSVI